MTRYEDHPALAVNWVIFSTSGHILRPEGLVIENFTHCQVSGNRHVKLIANPLLVEAFLTSHSARFTGGAKAVNELGTEVEGPYSLPPAVSRVCVNHYWTKSVEDFLDGRTQRGTVDRVDDARGPAGLFLAERNYATGEDRRIQRFLPALREAVASATAAAGIGPVGKA
jgi:hypothetical protein